MVSAPLEPFFPLPRKETTSQSAQYSSLHRLPAAAAAVPISQASNKLDSHLNPQIQHTLCVLHNLITTQLALAVQAINKRNRHLRHAETHTLGPHHHLHLESVPLALRPRNHSLQNLLLVQPEASSKIAHARPQHRIREQVRTARDEFPLEIPAKDAAVASVAGAGHDVVVSFLLESDHLRQEFGVVAEVGVHDDDIVSRRELQAVDVGRAETEFACSRV